MGGMARLAFGVDEKLECIADVALEGPKGEALCLGYKKATRMIGGPVWVSDDGYVLIDKASMSSYFDMPQGAELTAMQQEGLIPDPLPAYSLTIGDYVIGTITWWIFGVMGLVMLFGHWRGRHRREFMAADVPPSTDPPNLGTEQDRWLRDTILELVEPGDDVEHQAYGFDSDPRDSGVAAAAKRQGLYVGLTHRALVVIHVKVGAFRPLLENQGSEVIPRSQIAGVEADDHVILFYIHDGRVIEFWPTHEQKHFTNQWRFSRDVPRLLGAGTEAA